MLHLSLSCKSLSRSNQPFCFFLTFLFLLSAVVAAQETTGSITGKVLDPSGATIPGAAIEVSGSNLPRPIQWKSDGTGSYLIPDVPVGAYSMSVSATGFAVSKQDEVIVILGRATRVDFKMQIGQLTDTITVTAGSSTIDTTASASAVNIDKSFFDLLPKGRSFYDLTGLAPGARDEPKSGGYQVDGASASENIYYVDGMEITSIRTGVLTQQNRVPVESIQQVQIKNGVMDAQYGGAIGGVVNAVVRSGTDRFHGQAGFYFNNDSMSARPRPTLRISPFDTNIGEYFQRPMDDFSTWNPVGNVGGPILKDKLFFFTGYMPTRIETGRTVRFNTGQTGYYTSTLMQHYLTNKLDFMPWSKLNMSASWIWNPVKNDGVLPAAGGTDAYNTPWAQRGDYTAGNIVSGQVNYIASSKLVASFRGGYNYTNFSDNYGKPNLTAIRYWTPNTTMPGIPDDLRGPKGWIVQSVARTDHDRYRRINLNADASYIAKWHGQHYLKGGWQMNSLLNEVFDSRYPDGYYGYVWDQSYACQTSQCSGQVRGTYGFYIYMFQATAGRANGDNMGLFLQDTWTVNNHLTLNLGLRTEREFVPSYPADPQIPSVAVEFPWTEKMAPRLGFAYDPKGDGKMKIYGSWGYFYDLMKYELPRSQFGGSNNVQYFYTLDDPNWVKQLRGIPADPTRLPGTLIERYDMAVPATARNWVDPNLKPMKQSTFDLGFDYSIRPNLTLSLRYTDRRLIRTIEDMGTLTPQGESFMIGNPGFGMVADPAYWDAGIPTTPKAKRNYDAIEVRLDRHFSRKYQFSAIYTYSRLYGNYSGLASSDENGRTNPNVNRYFDMPWVGYTEKGVFSEGRLATDRPNTFKLYGTYTLTSRLGATSISPAVAWWAGTLLTTEAPLITSTSNPAFPYGRGDLGRTPQYFDADVNLMHEVRPFKGREDMRVRFELSVFNLFNSATVTDRDVVLINGATNIRFATPADIFKGFNTRGLMNQQNIRVSPTYNRANWFMDPRNLRIQAAFMF